MQQHSAVEQVFVVARRELFGGDWPQGFLPMSGEEGKLLLAELAARGHFHERGPAEADPSRKQLIPYCLVTDRGRLLCVHRKTAQSEKRLHGLWSIGLGGHVNPQDLEGRDTVTPELFEAALRRELEEELHLPRREGLRPVFLGLLNDDGNPVGRVHAGLVFRLDTSPRGYHDPGAEDVRVREVSKMAGGFRSLAELAALWQDRRRFETWSEILLKADPAALMGFSAGSPGSRPRLTSEESEHGG